MNAAVAIPLEQPLDLTALIHEPRASIEPIAAYLDGLDHARRVAELSRTSRSDQRRLFELAGSSTALTLEHFLPVGSEPGVGVVHHGRNTLPVPRKHRFFAKTMCRPEDGSRRAFGYNDSPSKGWIGPGYFVLHETAGRPEWEERGSWVVNYLSAPDGPVPEGWPRVRSNREGLQRLVYHGTLDFMRRVSSHVSIGSAYRGQTALDHYFTLCREP